MPVKQFWALTLYSENTRRPYDNGGTKISDVNLDSYMKQLKYNGDGSIDRRLRENRLIAGGVTPGAQGRLLTRL